MADRYPVAGVERISFRSTAAADVERFASDNYSRMSIRSLERGRPFEMGEEAIAAPGFSLGELWATDRIEVVFEPFEDSFVVDHLIDGTLDVDTEAFGTLRLGVGDVAVMPTVGRFRDTAEDLDLDVTTLGAAQVAAYAEQVHGLAAERFRLTGLEPVSRGRARRWRATVVDVRDRVLGNPMLLESPVALDVAFRTLAAQFIATFPNTAMDSTARRTRSRSAPIPRRIALEVTDYLHTHPVRPLDPAVLVRFSGVPAREAVSGLRQAGVDPAALLWACRLDGARRDLLDGDPGLGPGLVHRVAARWGFTQTRRFRVAYIRAFGETPEATAAH